MKTIKIFLLVLGVLSATSCEEEIADFTFVTTIVESVEIQVPNTGGEQQTLNAMLVLKLENGDGEINDYINKIKDIDIRKMSYRVSEFGGGDMTLIGNFSFYLDDNPILIDTELHPYHDFVEETIFSVNRIDIPESISSSNSQKMRIDKEIAADFSGDFSANVETVFTVEVSIELEVTANIHN
jgi:hypothetical protein